MHKNKEDGELCLHWTDVFQTSMIKQEQDKEVKSMWKGETSVIVYKM